MNHSQNIGAAFLVAARQRPNEIALLDEESAVTFGQMADLVQNFSLHFQRHGVSQNSTVAIKSDDSTVIIATVIATSLLGCRWIYVSKHLVENTPIEVSHYFESDSSNGTMHANAILIDEEWSNRPNGFELLENITFSGFTDENDPWLILPSSGTTGTPKLMALSSQNLCDRIKATSAEFASAPSRCVFLFALHSPPAVIRALSALMAGWGLILSADPMFWHKVNVSHVFGSPIQVANLLSGVSLPTKLRKALVGGDNLSDDLAIRLLMNFDTVVNTYGSTEANLVLENAKSLSPDGNISTTTVRHDSEVQIANEEGRELPDGQEGVVRIRNGYLAPGYLNNSEAEAVTFRNGWFYPGDRGCWSLDGNFIVTGRVNDLFNIGGTKVNAVLLDYTLMSVDGIRDAICFMVPGENEGEQLVAFVELEEKNDKQDIVDAAKLKILSTIGPDVVPQKFLYTEKVPRTENGKPNRLACVKMALEAREAKYSKSM